MQKLIRNAASILKNGFVTRHRRLVRKRKSDIRISSTELLESRAMLSAGQLDPTFGDGGIVVSNVEEHETHFHGADMAVQPDGHIVVVGTADSTLSDDPFESLATNRDSLNRDIVVMRWLPDGVNAEGDPLDHSFGDEGIVRINAGAGYDAAGALHLLPDGRILIAGVSFYRDAQSTDLAVHVWRLLPDGSIDETFRDGSGVATLDADIAHVTDMVVEASGRIIVIGTGWGGTSNGDFELWALNADGSTDTSYGTNGVVRTDFVNPNGQFAGMSRYDRPARALLVQDGKLLVIGPSASSSDGTVAARYNQDGSLDTSFANAGRFIREFPTMYDVALLGDGRYLLGGEYGGAPALMMLNRDGAIDTSFGENGISRKAVPDEIWRLGSASIHRLRQLSDGRIQAVISDYGQWDFWVPASEESEYWVERVFAQFLLDGSLDTSLSEDGWLEAPDVDGPNGGVFRNWGFIYGDIWQDNGNIVLMRSGEAGIARFLPDFTPDPTFQIFERGNYRDRDALVRLPSSDEAHGVTLLPNGQILVTGRSRGLYPTEYLGNLWPTASGALFQRYDASGRLDTSFDGKPPSVSLDGLQASNGSVVINRGTASHRTAESGLVRDVLLLEDGSVFAPTLRNDRELMYGEVVNEFGEFTNSSFYTYSGTGDSEVGGVARLADGRIVVAGTGYAWGTGTSGTNSGTIAILSDEGNPHPSFKLESRWYTDDFFPVSLLLTSHENLILASVNAIRTYNLAGNVLATFESPFPADTAEYRDLALQDDGSVLVTGVLNVAGTKTPFVSRFLSDGTLDRVFGTAGSLLLTSAAGTEANAIATTDSGQIILWGASETSLTAIRVNPNGTLDSEFGNGGTTQIVAAADAWQHVGTELAVQPDGAIIGVGYVTHFDGREDVVVVRLLDDDTPPTPSITHVSPDTGRHDRDAVTNSGNLQIHGRSTPLSTIYVNYGENVLGTTVADTDGYWTFDYSAVTLTEGIHQFSASASSGFSQSDVSSPFEVTIDQTAPKPSVPRLSRSGDWYPAEDNVVNYASRFSGSTEGQATVSLYMDERLMTRVYRGDPMATRVRSSPSDNSDWNLDTYNETQHVATLAPGPHDFSTVVEDVAGNRSVRSESLRVWFVQEGTLIGRPEVTVSGYGTFSENDAEELLFSTPQSGLMARLELTATGPLSNQPDLQGLHDIDFDGATHVVVPVVVDDDLYEPDETFEFTQRSSLKALHITPETFSITILNDDLPTISPVPNLITTIDQPLTEVPVTIGNFGESVDVPLSITSDNSALFPSGNLTITGEGADRRLTLTPASGQTGTATITLRAGHGTTVATEIFTVAVDDGTATHGLAIIPDKTVDEDHSVAVDLVISGADPDDVVVTANAVNSSLLPSSGIHVIGDGTDRRLILSPAANAHGETSVIVEATNSTGQTVQRRFHLTVNPVDDSQAAMLSGRIWEDLNGDGIQDGDEPPTIGTTVFADINRNGSLENTEPSTVTVSDGTYQLSVPGTATYLLRSIAPDNFEQTFPLATAPQLYVGSWFSNQVSRFTADGNFHSIAAAGNGLDAPNGDGLAVDSDGNLLVGSSRTGRVLKVNPATSEFMGEIGSEGAGWVRGVDVGPGGDIYVADETGDVIRRYDGSTGEDLGVFVSGGGLNAPIGIEFDPNGHLYVANRLTDSVLKFDGSSGAFIEEFATGGGLDDPYDLKFDTNGDLYVTSFRTDQVLQYSGLTGEFMEVFADGVDGASALEFGADGDLYVASFFEDKVYRVDSVTRQKTEFVASESTVDGPAALLFHESVILTHEVIAEPADVVTNLNFGVQQSGSPDLAVLNFDVANDVLTGLLIDVSLTIRNDGDGVAPATVSRVVWSSNDVVGDGDDEDLNDSLINVPSLAPGETFTTSLTDLPVNLATIYAHAEQVYPALNGSTDQPRVSGSGYFYVEVDHYDDAAESDETNNAAIGEGGSDDVTYFPWDVNQDGVVTARDALFMISRLGTVSSVYDFDGSGIVTPLKALATLQRIRHRRDDSVIESQNVTATVVGPVPTGRIESSFATAGGNRPHESTVDLFGERNTDEERQIVPQVGEDLAFEVHGTEAVDWLDVI